MKTDELARKKTRFQGKLEPNVHYQAIYPVVPHRIGYSQMTVYHSIHLFSKAGRSPATALFSGPLINAETGETGQCSILIFNQRRRGPTDPS
jgi:hypothetical protein